MRMSRIKESGAATYHVLSRIVDRQMVMDVDEKERFRRILRSTEAFSGCQVLTWTCLDNHWHVLLHVPERCAVSDEELVQRLKHLYSRPEVDAIAGSLQALRAADAHSVAEALKERYTCRMYDLSEFVKGLKQRFSQSYNRRHGRKGTLWEERFKSLLVGGPQALRTVAAYIDLNAVRAGIVEDPAQYRFSGYGEAVGGVGKARQGLMALLRLADREGDWRETAGTYRQELYVQGEADGKQGRRGFEPAAVQRVLEAGGRLPMNQVLRCRVRYFSDGVILGTRAFVDEAYARHKAYFSAKRSSGARPMRFGEWDGLCTARRLRLSVIEVPVAIA